MLLGNVMLAIVWTALSGFSFGNLALGFVVGYVILAVLAFGGVVPRTYHDKTAAVLSLVVFIIREFLMANARMAVDVIRPVRDLRPGIVAVPLDVETDFEILAVNLGRCEPAIGEPACNRNERARVFMRRRRIHQDRAAPLRLHPEIAAERRIAGKRQDLAIAPADLVEKADRACGRVHVGG